LVGFIIDIISAVLNAIPLIKKFRAPVIISPKYISLKAQPWNIKTTFHVQNRTSKILFNVWIKLTIQDCEITPHDIKIDSGSKERLLWENLPNTNISINYDQVRMDGIDDKGRQCIFFILHSLDPQIAQSFTLKVTSTASVEKNVKPQIVLERIDYSKAPLQILTKNNETSCEFQPPEGFKITSAWLRMKKE
jgi:hypothetical protein